MKKKKYKVVKTEAFKKQEKELPPNIRKGLNNVIDKLSKNPLNAPGSMDIFSKPSAEELKQWMDRIRPSTTSRVLEYLYQKGCLNKTGKKISKSFDEKYVFKKSKK